MGYSCFNVYYTLLYIHDLLYLPLVSNLMSLDAFKDVRPKKGNREKHQEKRRKRPRKQRKHYVKHGKRKGEWGECEELLLTWISWTFSHQFSSRFIRNNLQMQGNLQCFSCIFFLVKLHRPEQGFYTKLGSVQYLYEVRHTYTEQEIRGREFRLGNAFFFYFLFNVDFQYLQYYRLRNLAL